MRLTVLLLLPLLPAAYAATLQPFQPKTSFAIEENLGQVPSPARHFAAGSAWGFSCSTLYHPSSDEPGRLVPVVIPGASESCIATLNNPAPGLANYYRGSDPSRWVQSVPRYHLLQYTAVFPGLDLIYTAEGQNINWNWRLAPHADTNRLRFRFPSDASLSPPFVHANGGLNSAVGTLPPPIATQAGRPLPARYIVSPETGEVSIEVTDYDPAQSLDVSIALPTYASPLPTSISARAPQGNWFFVYGSDEIAQLNESSAPCLYLYSTYSPCRDVAVSAFNPAGEPLWTTYLIGERHELPAGIAVDPGGNVYVNGSTYSTDFPVTPGAAQAVYAGPSEMVPWSRSYYGGDAFAAKLWGPAGALIVSTFTGGEGSDRPLPLQIDAIGRVTMVVDTYAYEPGDYLPALVTHRLVQLRESFQAFNYARDFSPGSLDFEAAPDGSAAVILDSRLTLLDPSGGETLSLSAPEGTSFTSLARAPDGTLFIAADRLLPDDSSTPVLAILRPDAHELDYRGGWPFADLSTDASGNLYVLSQSFPDLVPSSDAILRVACPASRAIIVTAPDLSPIFSSYLPPGNVPGVVQDMGLGPHLFIGDAPYTLDLQAPTIPYLGCVTNSAWNGSGVPPGFAPGSLFTLRGRDIGADSQILIGDLAAPIVEWREDEIVAVVPHATPYDKSNPLTLHRGGQTLGSLPIDISRTAFAVFNGPSAPLGLAILNDDGTPNSPDNPATPGSVIRFYGSGAGLTDPLSVDGATTFPVLPKPLADLKVEVGDTPAEVLSFQQSPDHISGIMEVQLRLPQDFAWAVDRRHVALQLSLHNDAVLQSLTIAVK